VFWRGIGDDAHSSVNSERNAPQLFRYMQLRWGDTKKTGQLSLLAGPEGGTGGDLISGDNWVAFCRARCDKIILHLS
jgi:hypothetical protein